MQTVTVNPSNTKPMIVSYFASFCSAHFTFIRLLTCTVQCKLYCVHGISHSFSHVLYHLFQVITDYHRSLLDTSGTPVGSDNWSQVGTVDCQYTDVHV